MRGILNILFYTTFWLGVTVLTVGLGLVVVIPVLLLTFTGTARRATEAKEKLVTTLMSGETLIASGIQHRLYALLHGRVLIAITASRVVGIRRGLLGGFTMQDIQWKDLKDVTIEENMFAGVCGSNLTFAHSNGRVGKIDVPGVLSGAARQIYSRAQSEEQAWEEKHRVRAIEEVRAASGGITLHSGPSAPTGLAPNRFDEIAKAKELLDAGAISDAEYNEMKSKILGAI